MEEQTRLDGLVSVRVPLRDLEDGQRVAGVYAVRERELRRKRNGEPWLRLAVCDASGSAEAVCWEDAEALYAIAAAGSAVHLTGVFEVSERWGAKIKLSGLRAAEANEYDPTELAPESDLSPDLLERDLRALLIDDPGAAAARAARPLLRPRHRGLGTVQRGAGGKGLPPGLPARAARAHALRRPGGQRRGQLLPRDRPRRRRRRGAAARHRQDRGLQLRPAGDRPHRPRPPAGRDPARLLPGAPRN